MNKKLSTEGASPKPLNPDALYRWSQISEYLPVSRATWLEGVRRGRFPAAVKLGPMTTCWRGRDLLKLLESGVEV